MAPIPQSGRLGGLLRRTSIRKENRLTMSRKTKTFLAISMALLLGVSPHTQRAEAQIGLPGLATEFTQLANKLQLLLAYTRQGQQLANQLQMYQNMAQNSRTLPSQSFSPLVADITALNTI